jgi:hypothetical protein
MVDREIEKWKAQVQSGLENWKAQVQSKLVQYEVENALARELFKSVILTGQGAFKSVVLIKGGAAIALLAFVGTVWSNGVIRNVLLCIIALLALFCLGTLLGGIASGLTYLAQKSYASDNIKSGDRLTKVIVMFCVIAYALFFIACLIAGIGIYLHLSRLFC